MVNATHAHLGVMKGNGRLRKLAIDTPMKKTPADSKAKERNLDLHTACLVNSCQGKDAGDLFILNHSIHPYNDIGCDTSF